MSPEVWQDAKPRIAAAAQSLGISVLWPNEKPALQPNPVAMWLDVECSATQAAPIEIGGQYWEEDGTLWLHLMIPVGTGILDGLTARKALSTAFRNVQNATPGLIYGNDQAFDPLGPGTDDGLYRRLTLMVRYRFQDLTS